MSTTRYLYQKLRTISPLGDEEQPPIVEDDFFQMLPIECLYHIVEYMQPESLLNFIRTSKEHGQCIGLNTIPVKNALYNYLYIDREYQRLELARHQRFVSKIRNSIVGAGILGLGLACMLVIFIYKKPIINVIKNSFDKDWNEFNIYIAGGLIGSLISVTGVALLLPESNGQEEEFIAKQRALSYEKRVEWRRLLKCLVRPSSKNELLIEESDEEEAVLSSSLQLSF